MSRFSNGILILILAFAAPAAFANDHLVRWTGADDADGSVAHIFEVLGKKLGRSLDPRDFLLQEDRDLAFNHYKRLVQLSQQVPIHGKSIRIWTELGSDKAIQVEADLEAPKAIQQLLQAVRAQRKAPSQLQGELTSEQTMRLVRRSVESFTDDPYLRGVEWKDEWKGGELRRLVRVKGKRGVHLIEISLVTKKIAARGYQEFPQADQSADEEISIPVQVFPIYEETEALEPMTRTPALLRHILKSVPLVSGDIYAPLKTQRYFDSKFDPSRGATEAGRAQGYWSMGYLKDQAAKIRASLPQVPNELSRGLLLQGRYATINIHPDAVKQSPWNFQLWASPAFFPNWVDISDHGDDSAEMIPTMAFFGKPIFSIEEAWNRPARRLADHDPVEYLKDGFDEIQVYYAIDTLFEELRARGFTDPELSTRPFNAFLFNPDIAYRDNAFYTDDTINFTTYSPKAQNFARDNTTIWHELGHGVMDRLMGDSIELADTGGLSEGMADFVAQMVIQAVTDGVPFPGSDRMRIINRTGFFLTNEVHDDGEAYGGTMNDFMMAAIERDGRAGLHKVVDLVLEAMRLTRDFPGLTASDWFSHILFADSLGRPGVRAPGELRPLLLQALAGRNFKMNGGAVASFPIINMATQEEVVAGKPGSRQAPILVEMPKTGTRDFEISVSVKGSDQYSFRYPVQVKVQFNGGPLQGAVHWVDEEKGSRNYTLNSEADLVKVPLQASGTCDEINRVDGSCVDFVYVQAYNAGESGKPVAKKRFYLRVKAND